MPLTDQNIRALVHLAAACRPSGAPRWDEAGIFAAIAKVRSLNIADVALAVIRAADDANAKTPGVIANTSAPNWSERAISRPVPREPYDPNRFCTVCNRSSHVGPADHEFVTAVEHLRQIDDRPKPRLPRVRELVTEPHDDTDRAARRSDRKANQ